MLALLKMYLYYLAIKTNFNGVIPNADKESSCRCNAGSVFRFLYRSKWCWFETTPI